MAKSFLIPLLLFLSIKSFAHQPDVSSTLLVQLEDGRWLLQVRSSLTAFEYEVHHHFGKDSYADPEEFQVLVLEHLKEHISLSFDQETKAILKNGQVKLGHETNAVFELEGVPEDFPGLAIHNSSFGDIHGNQSALVVLRNGFQQQRFILNDANGHSAKLKTLTNSFELQAHPGNSHTHSHTHPHSH